MIRPVVFLALGLVPLHALAAAPVTADRLNAAANHAYLAANATRAGVISRPDGLQYRILASGFGKRPAPSDTVQLAYSAKLIDGSTFDGTSPGLPATLGVNTVIRGMAEALQMMHVGDRWQLVIPSGLGFGAKGAGNGLVPPDQTLVFDVSLLAVLSAPPPSVADSRLPIGISAWSQGREEQGHATLTFPQ